MIDSTFNFFVNVAGDIGKGTTITRKFSIDHLGTRTEHSFFISPAIPMEIYDILSLLKAGKSVGPKSIPTKLLKIISPYIYSPLSDIFDDSFQPDTFSENFN